MTGIIQRLRNVLQVHWSLKINGNIGSRSFSIICSPSLELMRFPCIIWCGKTTIQMQMGTSPTLFTRRYNMCHWWAITMNLINIQSIRHWCHSQQYNYWRIGLRLIQGTERGGDPWHHQGITSQEKAMLPGTFLKQSNSVTHFIITIKGQWILNSFLPSSRRCTIFLRKKASKWGRMLIFNSYLNQLNSQIYINQLRN